MSDKKESIREPETLDLDEQDVSAGFDTIMKDDIDIRPEIRRGGDGDDFIRGGKGADI